MFFGSAQARAGTGTGPHSCLSRPGIREHPAFLTWAQGPGRGKVLARRYPRLLFLFLGLFLLRYAQRLRPLSGIIVHGLPRNWKGTAFRRSSRRCAVSRPPGFRYAGSLLLHVNCVTSTRYTSTGSVRRSTHTRWSAGRVGRCVRIEISGVSTLAPARSAGVRWNRATSCQSRHLNPLLNLHALVGRSSRPLRPYRDLCGHNTLFLALTAFGAIPGEVLLC